MVVPLFKFVAAVCGLAILTAFLVGGAAMSLLDNSDHLEAVAAESGVAPVPPCPTGVSHGLQPVAQRAEAFVRSHFRFRGTIGGFADRNIAGTNTKSKHASGLAIDVMVPLGRLADRITNYFAGAGYDLFKVDNVIHNRRIYNLGRGWHAYSGVSPHTDHVHVDFLSGAAGGGDGAC